MGNIKEVVFLSGKGGVGKTSIAGSISFLLQGKKVICDCDVDAANLFLVMGAKILEKEDFLGGKKAHIKREICTACSMCIEVCEFGAISPNYTVDPILCEGCGSCYHFCPSSAISFEEKICGRIYRAVTKTGDPFFYAELNPGEENSGKLVQKVREKARKEVEEKGAEYILIDGPPGIGCPVISSLVGVNLAVTVCEPNPASFHDLLRILELIQHFGVKPALIINRVDVNSLYAEKLRTLAKEKDIPLLGEISYDTKVTEAQRRGKLIVEIEDYSKAKFEMEKIHEKFKSLLEEL